MKRREFIAASAAVAASSLLPQTPAWARGRKVRLAMIGTGMRGLGLSWGRLAKPRGWVAGAGVVMMSEAPRALAN